MNDSTFPTIFMLGMIAYVLVILALFYSENEQTQTQQLKLHYSVAAINAKVYEESLQLITELEQGLLTNDYERTIRGYDDVRELFISVLSELKSPSNGQILLHQHAINIDEALVRATTNQERIEIIKHFINIFKLV